MHEREPVGWNHNIAVPCSILCHVQSCVDMCTEWRVGPLISYRMRYISHVKLDIC